MREERLTEKLLKQISEALQNMTESASTEDYMSNRLGRNPLPINKKERTRIMLYRVFYSTNASEYGRCFTDRREAERFYNGLLKSKCYRNVKLQIG